MASILLLCLALLLGMAGPARAEDCSQYQNGLLDGFAGTPAPSQLSIDRNCTIRNYPGGMSTNMSFDNPGGQNGQEWLVIFDNVNHTGQMSCNAVHDNKIWFVNGSFSGIHENCQNLLIPVEKINKLNPPGNVAAIGVPFTWRLVIPVLFDPATGTVIDWEGSANELHSITVWDDLNAMGVDLSYVSHTAYWLVDGAPGPAVSPPPSFNNAGGALTFDVFPIVPIGDQFVIELTVVLEDTPNNTPGKTFINTARWDFGRLIDDVFYEPLPGENGISPPMTIAAPQLVMTKTGPATLNQTLNLGEWGEFALDVQNTGLTGAWDVNILDRLPDGPTGGTCDQIPELLSVTLAGNPLTEGTHYSTSYTGAPTCELKITLLDAAGPIAPTQHLIVTYRTRLDANSQDGVTLTNVAGATEWFNDQSTNPDRITFTRSLTDGTPGVVDHQDAHTVTVDLHGYFFEKTVANLTTGVSPAITAAAGDTLRYTLRMQATEVALDDLSFLDDMGVLNPSAVFVPGSLTLVPGSIPAGADTSNTNPNGGTNGAGLLDIRNLDVPANGSVQVQFDLTLDSTLGDGTLVINQAGLISAGASIALSDDPNRNGQADPDLAGDEDPTQVVIRNVPPPPLLKAITQATAAVGVPFAYRITVPETPYPYPLNDVRILDDLAASAADLRFVSVARISGSGSWTPTNTGSSTQLVIEDPSGGIDIPADEQIVVEITVVLEDTAANTGGLSFSNTADYTYNRIDQDDATQLPGAPGTSPPMTIVEPVLTLDKSGPAQMTIGTPGAFSLDVHNPSTTPAFNLRILDRLPNVAAGGMCDAAPTAVSAQLFLSGGAPGAMLVQGTDFSVSFVGAPTCELTLTILTAAGTIGPDERLVVSYQTLLDADTQNGAALTNIAGATQWLSAAASAQVRRTYTETLTDGTPGVLDHEDAHTVTGQTNTPSLFAPKAVALSSDAGTPNVVDPGDVLRYTITVHNSGGVAATNATLTDSVPANTSYVANSTTLNGIAVPDGGVFPLAAGLPISSSDLTPPLPGAGAGTISSDGTAVITFELQVDAGVPGGTVISNQAVVGSTESPDLLTDGDGDPATGPEPTVVIVGAGQQLLITKQVAVVGGGAALPGATLEYVVTVQNVALVPALGVVITDDLGVPTPGQLLYVDPSATLNGSATGITVAGTLITADYFGVSGPLAPNQSIELRFRATIAAGLAPGTTLTNTGIVTWNTPPETASASVSIDVGATPGMGTLNGTVWHDADFDDALDPGELLLAGWIVELYQGGTLLQSATTDSGGIWTLGGVAPNDAGGVPYELRFRAPNAGGNTAKLGRAASAFTNALQLITGIVVPGGSNLLNLDLPVDPNGVVYASIGRTPVSGAMLTLLNSAGGAPLPSDCFDDPVQQGQVTRSDGYYKFDLNFSDALACPVGASYLIAVTPPGATFAPGVSQIIPPTSGSATPPLSVPTCPGTASDAVPGTAQHCEAQLSEFAPSPAVPPGAGTVYHLHLLFDDSQIPGSSQIFNNHIPLDPVRDGAVSLVKTTPSLYVSHGQLVPYEITFTSEPDVAIPDLSIVDRFPAGFSYVKGSAQIDGVQVEPTLVGGELRWTDLGISTEPRRLVLLLAVGAGVTDGEFVNRAQAVSSLTGEPLSNQAYATVRVVPDPTFSCTDVLGKVFDDANRNGIQDGGERGLAGVRLATARGLIATTDQYGRFHITCAVMPRPDRGSNFVLKLDDRTLPSGYRMTTRPLQTQRATLGKALNFHFGASIQRVVGLDLADPVFAPGSTEMRPQWQPRLDLLLEELAKGPAVLRLSYLADVEQKSLVDQRVRAVKKQIEAAWKARDSYQLTIETEVFWRRGAPPAGSAAPLLGGRSWDALLPSVDAGPPVLEAKPGTAVEKQMSTEQPFMRWSQDPGELDRKAGDRLEQREVRGRKAKTVKLRNVIPPIRFESGVAKIPAGHITKLRRILDEMKHLENVRLHLVGHADNEPLSPGLSRLFGDNEGLSAERAGEVAEYLKTALGLPSEAISFAWAGDTQPIASNATAEGRAQNRRVEVEVWYDEFEEKIGIEEVVVPQAIKRVKICRTETVCKLRYLEGHERRARVRNLIAPLHYGDEAAEVTDEFVRQVEQTLSHLSDKQNVTVKFIGFTDDAPLSGRTERIYGTQLALSKARAHRVALAVQDALRLPTSAIASDGFGATRPVASNETERGRALNRRIEVEFWHDDPLQELPDEPQPCPDAAGDERLTRVYDPPWGPLPSLQIVDGEPTVPPGYTDALRRAMNDVADKEHVRLRFVGYTKNERLDRRTARVYGDDIGLSVARARRTMEKIKAEMGLSEGQAEHEGRGYLHSEDVVNAGFLEGETSHVAVQVVYDELAVRDDLEGIDSTPITRELSPKEPLALNLMRITVDGEPIDDPGRSVADLQRCTDVALEKAEIQFRFDDLESDPRLSVTSQPAALPVAESSSTQAASFRMYTNYPYFIDRSEIRIFEQEQSLEDQPLAVVPVETNGLAQWQPPAEWFQGPVRNLKFVLRSYDADGHFDETAPQSLWQVYGKPVQEAKQEEKKQEKKDPLLAGYGEDGPSARNIPLGNVGAVRVHGSGIPPEHSVWLAGAPVPVDEQGSFVGEVILPSGAHTVEVAVLDQAGNGELFLRDLEFPRQDWFFVGISDLTMAPSLSGGTPDELIGEDSTYDDDSWLDGRLAFYLTGKFGEDWKLTASADTREGSIKDAFRNFLDKAPESLFRRIDPDYSYPTFGDDGTVEETAPTQGKFFAKLSKEESHAMWGNFKVGYLDNELAQVDRGLYGGNLHYQSSSTTRFGEKRLVLDGFAAEPGTVGSREELRGTGGSLYYLRRQDLLTGSERVRIEIRDKDSGLVNGVVHLRPTLDYDIDYLQGRILLTEPLPAIVGDGMLIRNEGLSGDEAWLVVQYEYTPGLDELDALAAGGQGRYWLNEYVGVGLLASHNQEEGDDSTLYAGDLTLRMSSDSWFKVQAGRSEGVVSTPFYSDDGGFSFLGTGALPLVEADANAYRGDISVGVADFIEGGRGRVNVYAQRLEGGYSAPGMFALSDTDHIGGAIEVPVTEKLELSTKADWRVQDEGLETRAAEVDLGYQLTKRWSVGAGVRNEYREDDSTFVPLTQQEGSRTDAGVQVGYDSKGKWRGYGFGQMTLAATGDREDNGRGGVGGAYRINDRLLFDGEVSHGQLGPAIRLGTSFQESQQTRRYLSYAYENEREYSGLEARTGKLISGVKSRVSDSSSVYLEDRFQHGRAATGLVQAMGITLTPLDRWSFSANWEHGDLVNVLTDAVTKRKAGGARLGYVYDQLQLTSGVEYRFDETEQLDESWSDRTTWLFRNTMRLQMNPDARLVAKFNHSFSDSSLGQFYDGGYTEAVVGLAYRPVKHDRLNALLKYTYLYDFPTADQVVLQNVPVQFPQKSHVASLDVTYDLTRSFSIGGKYAYRLGQVSLERENPSFFDNNAHLLLVRGDWRFARNWEGSLEGRMLELPDINDRRAGALFTIYRYLGDHFKVGVGYNFTDFSDDLTDLSYDHHGLFLNLVGTM